MPGPEDKDQEESFLTSADKFLRKWTGADYYERKTNAAKEGFKKKAPKTAEVVEKTADTLARGAQFEAGGGGPMIGMAKTAKGLKTAREAKDVAKGSTRETFARGPTRPAADIKKGDARSAVAAGKSARPKTPGQTKLMNTLNKSRDTNEAARTKAARIQRNSPTPSEQAKIGRAKRNDATPPTASEQARIGRAKRNDSSLTVADRARLGRMEKNSPSIRPDPAKAKAARMERNSPSKVESAKRSQGAKVAIAGAATAGIAGGYYGTTRWKSSAEVKKDTAKANTTIKTPPNRPLSDNAGKRQASGTFTSPYDKKRGGVSNPSTSNQGNKQDKQPKRITQGVNKGGYNGNWTNAGPAKKPKSLQEAVRGADAGSGYMRDKNRPTKSIFGGRGAATTAKPKRGINQNWFTAQMQGRKPTK